MLALVPLPPKHPLPSLGLDYTGSPHPYPLSFRLHLLPLLSLLAGEALFTCFGNHHLLTLLTALHPLFDTYLHPLCDTYLYLVYRCTTTFLERDLNNYNHRSKLNMECGK